MDNFPAGDENLAFVNYLAKDADAALFGRVSYELLNSYWPTAGNRPNATEAEIDYSDWYNKAQKIVLSKTLPKENFDDTTIISENIYNEITDIKQQHGKNILIFGSPTVSQLLIKQDLIDEYWIFINPIIFGYGLSLFSGLTTKIKLKLLTVKQFVNGEVALNYRREANDSKS